MRAALLRLVLALLLGAGAALGVLTWLEDADERAFGGAGDRVLAAVEGLRDDRVHVSDDGRPLLDEQGEAAIAAAIAERDLPVYVVVWQESRAAGYDSPNQAAEQMLHLLDEPAVLVLWQGPDSSTTRTSPGHRVVFTGTDGTPVRAQPEYLGDAALRLPEWLAQLPDEPLQALQAPEARG